MRLRRALVSSGVTIVPLPWDGNPIGPCWRVRFYHKATGVDPTWRVAGTVAFEIQPMTSPKPLKEGPGTCGAASRRSYTAREKARPIVQLRELENRSLVVWGWHGMSPLQCLSLKTGVPSANISKCLLEEAGFVKEPAKKVTSGLMKTMRSNEWPKNEETKLYRMFQHRG